MVRSDRRTYTNFHILETGIPRFYLQCSEKSGSHPCVEKEEIPAELHYGSSDRIGDIVVAPELGWQFTDVARDTKGAHGYFPQSPDMQVMFRAIGPDFKRGYISGGFVNVDIYPLLSHLLQIVPEKTDGRFERIKEILR